MILNHYNQYQIKNNVNHNNKLESNPVKYYDIACMILYV